MAAMLFTRAILQGEPIKVFNHGRMRRDFTYVDDIVQGVVRVLERPPARNRQALRYAIYNIGNHQAVALDDFIATLEAPARQAGAPRAAADATGRRRGDVRVDRRASRSDRLCAVDTACGRARPLRRLVSRLPRGADAQV